MIRALTGTLQAINEQEIILDIGALSFSLHVPTSRSLQLGQTITLQTYLHWNQEQGPSLFGFTDELERAAFLLIISCSGIGPKIALAALGQLGAEQFLHAVQTSNETMLSQVSGIGSKKAEQMIAHLRHKVGKLAKVPGTTTGATISQWDDVTQALISLNYTRTEITHAMRYLGDTYSGTQVPFDQLMRHALSFLAKKS